MDGRKLPKRHDAGSQANETDEGLNASDEAIRHGAEDIPTGANEKEKDIPVVNAGGILQRQAGVKVQHGRKQQGPRYRGPCCLSRFIPEGRCPRAVLTGLGVTGVWSERA